MSRFLKRLQLLDKYKGRVVQLFPALPSHYVDEWAILEADAFALGYFLECYPREVVVLDIGTFVGISALFFASQPKVLRVISVDPNPPLADEINDKSGVLGVSIDPEPLQNLKVLDIAQAVLALAEFADEQQKIHLRVGTVGSCRHEGVQVGPLNDLEKVEVPALKPSDGVSLIAFVDGLHTREGVEADLKAIFGQNPNAIAILHDCRGPWGPFVQAGVASFIEASQHNYRFCLFERLWPGVGVPNLGVVYHGMNAAEVEHLILKLHDPLHFLKLAIQLEVRERLRFRK